MRFSILRKRWKLLFVPKSARRGWFGKCSDPEMPNRTITIESGHSQQKELEVLVHECLHATCFPLDEQYVTDSASDIAKILWRLGWRKTDDQLNQRTE